MLVGTKAAWGPQEATKGPCLHLKLRVCPSTPFPSQGPNKWARRGTWWHSAREEERDTFLVNKVEEVQALISAPVSSTKIYVVEPWPGLVL